MSEWYDIELKDEEDMRYISSERMTMMEKVASKLNLMKQKFNLEYISNFGKYVKDDEIKCNGLLVDRDIYGYKIGTKIASGKIGSVSELIKENISLIIKEISGTYLTTYLSLSVFDYKVGADPDHDYALNDYWHIYNQKNVRKIISVGGDDFANQTSMHIFLNIILGNNDNYIRQYDAFYCGDSGYNIIEKANNGDLHDYLFYYDIGSINDDLLYQIFNQVLTPLSILKDPKYKFSHSDLKAKNVFVHKKLDGSIVYKIADYDKSSLTFNGFRFYNNKGQSKNLRPYIMGSFSNAIPLFRKRSSFYYQLDKAYITNVAHVMNNPYGVPISWDVYTFILSLFGILPVYTLYKKGALPIFEETVKTIFGDYYDTVMNLVDKNHDSLISMTNIITLLENIPLLEDISFFYDTFDVIPPKTRPTKSYLVNFTQSANNHVCVTPCRIDKNRGGGMWGMFSGSNSTCKTNTYSSAKLLGTELYDWDDCSN